MPVYRSIVLALHSQFDVQALPEYVPRPQNHYADRSIAGIVPPLRDDKTSTCSVYIPVLPGSHFWISYSVSPPVPDDQQFFFKLFINGAFIVSWSTGKGENWEGKTVFAFYDAEDEEGKKRIEKRILCFTPPDRRTGQWTDVVDAFDQDSYLEIRVHRAHGRKRIEREVEQFRKSEHGKSRRGIDLVKAGRAGSELPKRFYKFALTDPTDQPFATFRYYYRTWEQIRELNLMEQSMSVSEDATELSVIEPCGLSDEARVKERGEVQIGSSNNPESSTDETDKPQDMSGHAYIPTGAPETELSSKSSIADWQPRHDRASTPPKAYCLSVPASCKLNPPEASKRQLPSIPQKTGSYTDTSYRPHPVYPVEEWAVRTPSPVKSFRDGISTPPLGRRRGRTPLTLMTAFANTWKRRGTSRIE